MDLSSALLDSWDRQCRVVNAVASLVDASNRHVKPSDDGWSLDEQLVHLYNVRWYWLSRVSRPHAATLREPSSDDLDALRRDLAQSGEVLRAAVAELLAGEGGPVGGYDHPVLFLQHMVWHEGWHVGLLMLGLRRAGQEPTEEWEEANVWGAWRTE